MANRKFVAVGQRVRDGKRVRITGCASGAREFLDSVEQEGVKVESFRELSVDAEHGKQQLRRPAGWQRFLMPGVVFAAIGGAATLVCLAYAKIGRPSQAAVSEVAATEPDSWAPGELHPSMPNLRAGPDRGVWIPEPGYAFVRRGQLATHWVKGLRHPTYAKAFAAATEGKWQFDPGYGFLETASGGHVSWVAGLSHPDFPHVRSSAKEGVWTAKAGYFFLGSQALDVEWRSGDRHPEYRNVVSGDSEGSWVPEAGYGFRNNAGVSDAFWVPGSTHRTMQNLVAGQEEGRWEPKSGWRFLNDVPGDLRVVRLLQKQPDWGAAAVWLGSAVVSHQTVAQHENSEDLLSIAGVEIARKLRDESIAKAVALLLPNDKPMTHAAIAAAISLSLDNRYSALDVTMTASRAALGERFRKNYPELSDAKQAADVVLNIMRRYFQ